MKASNITILLIVVVSIMFIAAIPITLKYKLNNNLFTELNPSENYAYDRVGFQMTNKLELSGLENCTIIPSDSSYMEIERLEINTVKLIDKGDTLSIGSIEKDKRASQRVRIFMPGAGKVICRDSNVLLRGSIKMFGIPSFSFDLENSKLLTSSISEEWRVYQVLDQLEINGSDSAYVNLSGSIRIQNLILSDVRSVTSGSRIKVDNMRVLYKGKDTVKSKSGVSGLDIEAF